LTHAVADDEGLVCAFRLSPVEADGPDVLKAAPDGQPRWLHFNLTDARAARWLREHGQLPEAALEVMLSSDARVYLDAVPGGFVAVLGDLDHEFHGDATGFHTLRIYIDDTRIITARRHPLKTTDRLRRELRAGDLDVKSPWGLFEQLIDRLGTTFGTAVTKLADAVDDAEEQILAGHYRDHRKTLGAMRRSLALLRRHLGANRGAHAPLIARPPAGFTADERDGLRQSVERYDAVAQDLALVQERARLLQEEIAGRLAEATNRNLFVLSIVTTTLLPITLITGVFGMNVGGLPWLTHRHGFWWVLLVMGLALGLTLWLLRRWRIM
jgi:zinc transporter